MKTFKDLTGKKFNKLIAVEPTDKRTPSNGCMVWKCTCDCGNTHFVNSNNLQSSQVKSCGCSKRGRKKGRL